MLGDMGNGYSRDHQADQGSNYDRDYVCDFEYSIANRITATTNTFLVASLALLLSS